MHAYLLMLITAASLAAMQSTDRTILRAALKPRLEQNVKGSTAVFVWDSVQTATGVVYVTALHTNQFDSSLTSTISSTGVVGALSRSEIEVVWTDNPSTELIARGIVARDLR